MTILTLITVGVLPLLLMWGEKHFKPIAIIGPVLICYGIGLLLGNIGIEWPKEFIENQVSSAAVPLAIPLLMFGSNPKKWRKMAPKAFLSFFAGVLAVIIVISLANFIWFKEFAEIEKISAMLVGVYTGGTPNLAAIGNALNVKHETIPTLTIIDTVLCAVYLLILLSVAEKIFGLFLKPSVVHQTKSIENESTQIKSNRVLSALLSVLLSAFCLGTGVALSILIKGEI
ncbi:MAG: DUF819 family protein, partial [Bacteroidia bacterium]